MSEGPDLGVMIMSFPHVAVHYNVLPESVLERVLSLRNDPDSDRAIETRLDMAQSCFTLGLIRDAAEIYDRILDIRHYDFQALYSGAHAHHILGENEKAMNYLERYLVFSRSQQVVSLMNHCAQHKTLPSDMPSRIPSLEELASLWDVSSNGKKTTDEQP